MSRPHNRTTGRPALLTMAVIIVAVAAMMLTACSRPAPAPLNLATVAPCEFEDGGGAAQTYPCVWDAATRGNTIYGPNAPRWYLYVDADCPTATVQPFDDMLCFDTREWGR